MFVTPTFCRSIVFSFSWEFKWSKEKLKTMLMQNFGVTNKEHYGMLWYFLEWSIHVMYTLCGYYAHFSVLLLFFENATNLGRQTKRNGGKNKDGPSTR